MNRSDAGQNIVMRHENIVSASPTQPAGREPGGGDASPHCSLPGSLSSSHASSTGRLRPPKKHAPAARLDNRSGPEAGSANGGVCRAPEPAESGKAPQAKTAGELISPAFLRAQAMACFRLANVALADRDFAEAGRLHGRSQQFRLAALRVEGQA